MAEVLLYDDIHSFTAENFVKELEAAKGEDLTVRISSNGGSVQYGWPMIAKFAEHEGQKLVKVDGAAHSMAAFFVAFADDVEALDVSQFVLHRAAYPEWLESSKEFMTDARIKDLQTVNDNLRKALESKIDVEAFEKVSKVTLDEMFSLDSRIDVPLNAKQAKKVGLINKIVPLTTKRKEKMTSYYSQMVASTLPSFLIEANKTSNTKPNIKMTLTELEANHPEVFAQAVAKGVAGEKDRVEAEATLRAKITAEVKADLEAEAKVITDGAAAKVVALKAETANEVVTAKVVDKAEPTALSNFESDLDKLK